MTITQFLCFYCGKWLPAECAGPPEHIIPACIGGTLGPTSTKDVCSACNQFMGNEVDGPFGRDLFIQIERYRLGLSNRREPPLYTFGRLPWSRSEIVKVHILKHGGWLFEILESPDAAPRLALVADTDTPEMRAEARRMVRRRFPSHRLLPMTSGMSGYEVALLADLQVAHRKQMDFSHFIGIDTWNRALVKIGLGLASLTIGPEYVLSEDAKTLRAYLWERDFAKRMQIPVRGRGGAVWNAEPEATKPFKIQQHEHLFMLNVAGPAIALVCRLFGKWEKLVRVASTNQFHDRLPEHTGVAWIVDALAKRTRGPLALSKIPLVEAP
jgi:hypothetical protein